MAKLDLPRWGPDTFERLGILRILESASSLRTITALVSPPVGETLDFSRAAATELSTGGVASLLRMVPWKGEDDRPPVLVTVIVVSRPRTAEELTQRLRSFLTDIWTRQLQATASDPPPPADKRLSPVMFLLVYTGREPWKFELNQEEMRQNPPELVPFDPKYKVLFLGIRFADTAVMRQAGALGETLCAWAADGARAQTFVAWFESALAAMEAMPEDAPGEPDRRLWLWFLIHLMVFRREVGEFPRLRQALLGAFSSAKRRREVEDMLRTVFDSCSEIGEIKARREVLLDLMTTKFGAIPTEDADIVRSMQSTKVLDRFLRRVITARDLDDMGLWDSMTGRE